MQPWNTNYARSLTPNQWPDEIGTRFVQDIANRIDSLPLYDPTIKATLAKFGVTELDWPTLVDWDINTISFRDEMTLLDFSAYFFIETDEDWLRLPYGEPAPEPVLDSGDGAQTIMIGFDGVLWLDDAGVISKSEVSRVCTDLDEMPDLSASGGERDAAIFSFHNF
jgi:hypothetical protein